MKAAPDTRSTRNGGWRVALLLAVVALASGAGAGSLRAQAAPVVLSGQVVDERSREAIPNVPLVIFPGRRTVLADQEGRFRVRLRPGDYVVTTSHLGYGDRQLAVAVTPEASGPLLVELTPEPHLLEAVRVTVDRFARRRHMTAMSSQVLDRARLVTLGGGDVWHVIRGYAGLGSAVPCGGRDIRTAGGGLGQRSPWYSGGDSCIFRRGQVMAPRFFIDDRVAFAGADELAGYLTSDIHHVEVYGRGEMIRVYTMAYVERVARGQERLYAHLW
jgi:hypothetical protein